MILTILSLSFTLPIAIFVWALCYAAILRRQTIHVPWRTVAWNMLAMWLMVAAMHRLMLPAGREQADEIALMLSWVVGVVLCIGTRWHLARQAKAAATSTESLPRLKG